MNQNRSLQQHVRELRAQGPGTTKTVSKAETYGQIPHGFRSVDKPAKHALARKYYRDDVGPYTVYIADYFLAYKLGVQQTNSNSRLVPGNTQPQSSWNGLETSQNPNPDLKGIAKKASGRAAVAGTAAAALALGVAYKAFSGGSSTESTSTSTARTPSTSIQTATSGTNADTSTN